MDEYARAKWRTARDESLLVRLVTEKEASLVYVVRLLSSFLDISIKTDRIGKMD